MSTPNNVISHYVRPFDQGAASCCAVSPSLTQGFDERIHAMAPDVLAASSSVLNASFSLPLAARFLSQSPTSTGSFVLSSPGTVSSIASPNITPAADEELALVQKKLGTLLDESRVLPFTAFLKQVRNQETFQKFKSNESFELNTQDARQLGFTGAVDFVSSKSKYHIFEQLHENESGYFVAAGTKKIVTAVRKWSFRDRVPTVSTVARQVMTLPEERAGIQSFIDIVKRHNVATQLAASGSPLVVSGSYRIGCRLLIVQPLAPSLTKELTPGITEAQAIKMLLDISRGVAGLHAKGFAHRDLKPDNIGNMRRGAGLKDNYKLNDFDTLSSTATPKEMKAITKEREAVVGTPSYMSPEACLGGRKYNLKASDVWSFGMTALEILFYVGFANSQMALPVHPFLPAKEAEGLMFQLGSLREEDGIDVYFQECIARKPALRSLYELVRETLHLDPTARITMAEFHERLAALVRQKAESDAATKAS